MTPKQLLRPLALHHLTWMWAKLTITMERKNMLDVTPYPAFTPAGDHVGVWASGASSGGLVIESDVDTNELNPDKGTYKPSTTEDDTDGLSMVPTSPPQRMTYAKAMSPKAKPGQLLLLRLWRQHLWRWQIRVKTDPPQSLTHLFDSQWPRPQAQNLYPNIDPIYCSAKKSLGYCLQAGHPSNANHLESSL